MELSWWEFVLVRVVVLLITAPAVVAILYLIFARGGNGERRWWEFWR